MRNNLAIIFLFALISLTSCSGSDAYLGEWKGTDTNGDKYTLLFKPKNFTINRANGDSLNFGYTQNSVEIKNSVRTYGIKLSDGRVYYMFFPIANDGTKCLMTIENGKPVYALSRTSYLSQDEIYKLIK